MTIQDILTEQNIVNAVIAILAGSVVIEVTPIKINPISWFSRKVLDKVNQERDERIKGIGERLDKHIADEEREKTLQCRNRILRFSNDVRAESSFTKEYWDAILIDIKAYEAYVEEHKEFENEICVRANKYLREVYDGLLKTNGFIKD